MEHLLEIEDRYYILADSPLTDQRTLVLKRDDVFAVFNAVGDIEPVGHNAQGIFYHDMRHLSRWQLRINGQRPIVLSARVTNDNSRVVVDLTNADISDGQHVVLPRGTIHLSRMRFLWDRRCAERLSLSNFGQGAQRVQLSIGFAADFADIFEIRGTLRARRGSDLPPRVGDDSVRLSYAGLDGIERGTLIECGSAPSQITENELIFEASLPPRSRAVFRVNIQCQASDEPPRSKRFAPDRASVWKFVQRTTRGAHAIESGQCRIESSNGQLNAWLRRSYADLDMLLTRTDQWAYPYAGVPWYSTPFGRDGIITGLESLWVNPEIAKGVLRYLADTQAQEEDLARDAQPGKILHERRTDEMSRLGEVPFGQYYGSVDATPLFVVLASEYLRHTADLQFIRSIWTNITRALDWMDTFGDVDGDGFIEYRCMAADGLGNQGWKDSHDAVFHADGALAEPPIALCEVQGYAYQAKLGAAAMARSLGETGIAAQLQSQARSLQSNFHERFWLEDLGTYALAFDGRKQPCRVRTSNAGHCMFSGIAGAEAGERLAAGLLDRDMYSGWGVRTLASTEVRYNPMSYHNGSIWPHDNALIAHGLAAYGHRRAAMRLFKGWLDASTYLELHRLPELCCGFRRRRGKGPTLYPVACSPQAWAAGAIFMLLNACLGISVDAAARRVDIRHPHLPGTVDNLRLHNLRVGDSTIDLYFHREKGDVGVLVTRRDESVAVMVSK